MTNPLLRIRYLRTVTSSLKIRKFRAIFISRLLSVVYNIIANFQIACIILSCCLYDVKGFPLRRNRFPFTP